MTAPAATPDSRPDPDPRRAALSVFANPGERLDYRVTLAQAVPLRIGTARGVRVAVDYVPDRWVLAPDSLDGYLAGLDRWIWSTLEAVGLAILDDLNNELVPRWLRVTVAAGPETPADSRGDGGGVPRHAVVLEDRQPHWTPAADRRT